jgi:hypothetical protein
VNSFTPAPNNALDLEVVIINEYRRQSRPHLLGGGHGPAKAVPVWNIGGDIEKFSDFVSVFTIAMPLDSFLMHGGHRTDVDRARNSA